MNIDCLTVLLMLKVNKTRSAGNYAIALILQLLGAHDADDESSLSHGTFRRFDRHDGEGGDDGGGALAQIKQSNPPVASSRLVAVSAAAAAVTALFVGNGAMRRGGLETDFRLSFKKHPMESLHSEWNQSLSIFRIGIAFRVKSLME